MNYRKITKKGIVFLVIYAFVFSISYFSILCPAQIPLNHPNSHYFMMLSLFISIGFWIVIFEMPYEWGGHGVSF